MVDVRTFLTGGAATVSVRVQPQLSPHPARGRDGPKRRPQAPMTERRRPARLTPAVLVATLVAALALAAPAPARGQSPRQPAAGGQPPVSLSPQVRASPDSAEARGQITAFVEAHLAQIATGDAEALGRSRDALSAPIEPAETSEVFKNVYAEVLSGQIEVAYDRAAKSGGGANGGAGEPVGGAIVRDRDELTRLNLAIVNERLARLTGSTRLGAATTKLVGDPAAQVALWGLKASGPLLPRLLENPLIAHTAGRPLVAAVEAAAARFPDNGPLIEEVYDALDLNVVGPTAGPSTGTLDNGVTVVLPAMQGVMQSRLPAFAASAAAGAEEPLPPASLAESQALLFMANGQVTQRQTPEQRRRTVALMRDLTLAAVAASEGRGGADRRDLASLLSRTGSALSLLAQGPLRAEAQKLQQVTQGTPQADLESLAQALSQAASAADPDLPPPSVSPAAAPAGATPASQSAD